MSSRRRASSSSTPSSTSRSGQLCARQMFERLRATIFGLSEEENERAVDAGYRGARALRRRTSARRGREVLDQLEARGAARHRAARPPVPQRSRASITRSWTSSRSSAIRCFAQDSLPHRRGHARAAVRRGSRGAAISRTRSTSPTCGRTPTARTPTARCGPPSSPRGIRTWWRSSCRASSAVTTRRSTR